MWFTEDAWSPIILCVVACVIFFIAWSTTRKSKLLIAIPLLILAAITIFFAEKAIVTRREQLEETIFELVDTFVRESSLTLEAGIRPEDVHKQFRSDDYFATQNRVDRRRVIAALLLVVVNEDISVKDVEIEMADNGGQAMTRFRVNGKVAAGSFAGHRVSYWEMNWQIETDGWKITRTQMLDPVNGEPKPIPHID